MRNREKRLLGFWLEKLSESYEYLLKWGQLGKSSYQLRLLGVRVSVGPIRSF